MIKTNLRVAALRGTIALAGAALCCSVAAQTTLAPGGTITFIGALAAPSFSVSVATSAGGRAPTAAQNQTTDTSGRTTYVTFLPEPNNPPNADLSLSVAGHARSADVLSVDFRDGKGHVVKPGAGGTYHLGALGGTLSMRVADAAPQFPAQATLLTSYH